MFTSDLGFFLNGQLLPNNSILEPSDIGIDNSALFCITNLANCCVYPYSYYRRGNWIFPNQKIVRPQWCRYPFGQSRHSSSVILHRNSPYWHNDSRGIFTCTIPDSEEKYHNLYVHIAEGKYG